MVAFIPDAWVQRLANDLIAFGPRILGAIAILVIGWVVGRIIARIVRRFTRIVQLDRAIISTPIGSLFGDSKRAVSRAFGEVTAWFIYAIAFLAAADVLAIQLLSQWISTAVSYLPAFFGGLVFILVGFILADFIGDMIERTETVTRTMYTAWIADGVRALLYLTVVIIGLDTMGFNVNALYLLTGALISGITLAVALGLGIALGWGAKDYVADNIEDWLERPMRREQPAEK